MTKTILTIAGTLALVLPLSLTKNSASQLPVETNNTVYAPIEKRRMSEEVYNSVCTRGLANQPAPEPEVIIGDFPLPAHCKEPNCGIGVYSPRANDEERCSYCNALKPVAL